MIDRVTEELRLLLHEAHLVGVSRKTLVSYIVDLIDNANNVTRATDETYVAETETIIRVARNWLDGECDITEAVETVDDLAGSLRNYLDQHMERYLAAKRLSEMLQLGSYDPKGLAIASLVLDAAEHARRAVMLACPPDEWFEDKAGACEGEWQIEHLARIMASHIEATVPLGDRLRPSLLAS